MISRGSQIKAPDDRPTIGLLLCKSQNRLVAEYALSGIDKPIGVAEYELVRALPETLTTSLPPWNNWKTPAVSTTGSFISPLPPLRNGQ